MEKIASFQIDHRILPPGMYISRVDGDITTFDLRVKRPNAGDYMDNLTMHSVEHMFATYIRSSAIGTDVIYFGPMGCQTGFYLLVRGRENADTYAAILDTLKKIVDHDGEMFGKSRKECGNYINLSLDLAKAECARYLSILERGEMTFAYPMKKENGK